MMIKQKFIKKSELEKKFGRKVSIGKYGIFLGEKITKKTKRGK